MTNHGIEFAGEQKKKDTNENKKTKKEKKDRFERNGVLEKKKMGVMTNHGIEFTKKKWV